MSELKGKGKRVYYYKFAPFTSYVVVIEGSSYKHMFTQTFAYICK